MKIKLIILALCLLAGFAGGAWLATERRSAELLAAYPENPGIIDTAPPPPAAPVDDPASALIGTLNIQDSLERSFRHYQIIGQIPAGEIARLMDRARELPDHLRARLEAAIFTRWMQLDRTAAMQWARPRIFTAIAREEVSEIAAIWLKADPRAALEEAAKFPKLRKLGDFMAKAALLAADGDPAAALTLATSAAKPGQRDGAIAGILADWSKNDPASAYARLTLIGDQAARETATNSILKEWAKRDPATALRQADLFIQQLGDRRAQGYAKDITEAAGRAAAEWALAQTGEVRKQATDGVLNGWFREDPAAALSWADSNGLLAKGCDLSYSLNHTAASKAAILKLPPSLGKTALIGRVFGMLTAAERVTALETVPPETRDELRARFAIDRYFTSPDAAGMLPALAEIPAGKHRVSSAGAIAQLLHQRFPNDAFTTIAAIADPSTRNAALSQYASTTYSTAPTISAQALESISDPAVRDEAKVRLFRSNILRKHPDIAQRWLENSDLSAEWQEVLRAELREK